jgi:hypothetical protein
MAAAETIRFMFAKSGQACGKCPGPVQVIATVRGLDLLLQKQNVFGDANTGECKSAVTSACALALARHDGTVNTVTSSPVLVRNDCEDHARLAALFGVSIAVYVVDGEAGRLLRTTIADVSSRGRRLSVIVNTSCDVRVAHLD